MASLTRYSLSTGPSGARPPPSGERRTTGPLELDISQPTLPVCHLTQQHGTAIPQPGNETAELVPGIGLGQGLGTRWYHVAGKPHGGLFPIERLQVEAQLPGKGSVEGHQPGRRHGHGIEGREETFGQTGVTKGERGKHGGSEWQLGT
ncbi:hypothetical protein Q427_18380 [Halomonas sp. BC04]|nr:hypothetical protein Q427_18380 [Halomonas sp. BC04]